MLHTKFDGLAGELHMDSDKIDLKFSPPFQMCIPSWFCKILHMIIIVIEADIYLFLENERKAPQ